ncbi:MAG: RluA family pseudouridine synthase [Prevotella sp.]|nr:RluA family pseudouridine synthase [Bacteroides sp.]MCM1366667.1 RluA family pseudouridine synthase [Prevotella sp.]MCM1437334.1 RluA family pseudouridine synthase [Prevotella sp.]
MMVHRRNGRRGFVEDKVIAKQNNGDSPVALMDFLSSPDFGKIRGDMPKKADLKIWLKYGHVMVNGVVQTNVKTTVYAGDWVELNQVRPFVTFKHPRMQIVYEDDDIIVVNKGYGLLSVGTGSAKKEATAYDILKEYVKKKHPANKIFVVHRLDRDTSGLMMFAKNIEAQEAMQHNWNNMVISRTYVALVEGVVENDEGIVKSNLGETSQFEVYSTKNPQDGKLAITQYRVLERGRGYTLMEYSLETGRKNQIRVHSKDLGHPIVGDRKYGANASPIKRLALHARTLRFAHPITRRDMNFELPVPSKFIGLLRHS